MAEAILKSPKLRWLYFKKDLSQDPIHYLLFYDIKALQVKNTVNASELDQNSNNRTQQRTLDPAFISYYAYRKHLDKTRIKSLSS